MTEEELELAVRNDVAQGVGLVQERAAALLKAYDAAVEGMNKNADVIQRAAAMCREARHVADLAIAVLKTFEGEQWDGIAHFVRAIEGRYSWVKTGTTDYQPETSPSTT